MVAPNPSQFPATHPDWEALLCRVAADPGDRLTRLVAADWLDDHLDELPDAPGPAAGVWARRAELIRVQCGHSEAPAADLARRADALLGGWSADRVVWSAEACPQLVRLQFPHLTLFGGGAVGFRDGFAEVITCGVDDWLRHGRAIRARQPVRVLHLRRVNSVPAAAWWDALPTLSELDEVTAGGADEFTAGWLREHLPPRVWRG